MGMYDESWCSSCGTSLPYSEEDVECGQCASEQANIQSNKLIEYMNIHLISLNQDLEKYELQFKDDIAMNSAECLYSINYMNGQIESTRHLLSVAHDILSISNERI